MPTTGLWRDGALLVVDLQKADFGGRCPWTNELEKSTSNIPVFGPRPAGWHVTVRQGLIHGAKQQLLVLRLPASRGWLQRRNAAKRKFGFVIAGLGFAALLAGIVLTVLLNTFHAEVFNDPHPNPFTVSVILGVLGLAGLVAGFAWPSIEGAPGPGGYIQAELIDEPHIWLRGSNQEFRNTLPAWDGEPLNKRKVSGPTFVAAVGQGWPIMVVVFLAGIVVATLLLTAK